MPKTNAQINQKINEFMNEIQEKYNAGMHSRNHYDWQKEGFYKDSIEFITSDLSGAVGRTKVLRDFVISHLVIHALIEPPANLKQIQKDMIEVLDNTLKSEDLEGFQYGKKTMLGSEIFAYVTGRLPLIDPQGLLNRIEESAAIGHFPSIILNIASQPYVVAYDPQDKNLPDQPVTYRDEKNLWPNGCPTSILDIFPDQIKKEADERIWNAFREPKSLSRSLKWLIYNRNPDCRMQLLEPASQVIVFTDKHFPEVDPLKLAGLTVDEAVILLSESYPWKDYLSQCKSFSNIDYFFDPIKSDQNYKIAHDKITSATYKEHKIDFPAKNITTTGDVALFDMLIDTNDSHFLSDLEVVKKLTEMFDNLDTLGSHQKCNHRFKSFERLNQFLRVVIKNKDFSKELNDLMTAISVKVPPGLLAEFNELKSLQLSGILITHQRNKSELEEVMPVLKDIVDVCKLTRFPAALQYKENIDYLRSLPKEAMDTVYDAFTQPYSLNYELNIQMNLNYEHFSTSPGKTSALEQFGINKDEAVSLLKLAKRSPFLVAITKGKKNHSKSAINKINSSLIMKQLAKRDKENILNLLDTGRDQDKSI